jgi:hypothetical protein
MNNQVRQGNSGSRDSRYSQLAVVLWLIPMLLFLSMSPVLLAQDEQSATQPTADAPGPAEEPAEAPEEELEEIPVAVTVTLPNGQQMAMAVSTPELRPQALLDLAVAAHVVSRAEEGLVAGNAVDHVVMAQMYLDDRAWLQMLTDRHGWVKPHSSVLDAAAWQLIGQLQQHDLENMPLLIPGSMPEQVLIYQVFQRASQPLAISNLPDLLLDVEADAVRLWNTFLQLTEVDGASDAAWKVVETAWFTDRLMPPPPPVEEPPADEATQEQSLEEQLAWLEGILPAMSEIARSAVEARPPDSKGLIRLRYSILERLPELIGEENANTLINLRDSLYLLSLIDGLHEGRYFEFVQGLLSITYRLLELPVNDQEAYSLLDWLLTELPAISAQYARDFAAVDTHLNTAMTASYSVLVNIAGFEPEATISEESETDLVNTEAVDAGPATLVAAADGTVAQQEDKGAPGEEAPADTDAVDETESNALKRRASRLMLANAVAQLALVIPDMAYYFDTPVRAKIARDINTCIGLAAGLDDSGNASMTRRQFDSCLDSMLRLADRETRLAELSGDMNGPFTTDTLRRELSVAPWQRINYAVGYLHERFSTECLPPANVLPNPLEWAVLANIMSWYAEKYPAFFESTENENRIAKMRIIGEEIVLAMVEQSECLAASGSGFNDLISRIMTDYEIVLRDLDSGMSQAETDFRATRLKAGADVVLVEDAAQNTAFRPDDLVITPCDMQKTCEMTGNLSATRALIGLFPDEYLLAEQTGMGRIEICYRNMEWVDRRSELVRADDENVANYFGRLGFDLVGRYVENERISDVFGFRFTGSQEHHYLFAQASEEVLNDSCPVKWVGSRMVTPLRENRGGIVPNRLTYLAAARKLPSRLLQNNWDKGEEWRDWFVTGIGVEPLELPVALDITASLNQHLQSLYQAQQLDIYQRILLPNARNAQGDDVSLFDEMSEVTTAKNMLRTQMMLFYPESLHNSDSIRKAIIGNAGLLEQRVLRRFREDDIPMTSVNKIARDRLFEFREDWSKQPDGVRNQASLPVSLVHALTRINNLYRQFFITRPEVLQEVEAATQAEPEGEPET